MCVEQVVTAVIAPVSVIRNSQSRMGFILFLSPTFCYIILTENKVWSPSKKVVKGFFWHSNIKFAKPTIKLNNTLYNALS